MIPSIEPIRAFLAAHGTDPALSARALEVLEPLIGFLESDGWPTVSTDEVDIDEIILDLNACLATKIAAIDVRSYRKISTIDGECEVMMAGLGPADHFTCNALIEARMFACQNDALCELARGLLSKHSLPRRG